MRYNTDIVNFEDLEKRKPLFKGLDSLQGVKFDIPKLQMFIIDIVTLDEVKDENIFFFVKENNEICHLAARAEIDKYILKRDYALKLTDQELLQDYHRTMVKFCDSFYEVDDGVKAEIQKELNEGF